MRRRFLVPILCAALGCHSPLAPTPGASDVAAVRELLRRGAERFSAHDVEGYLAIHAPDADLVNVNGRRWSLPGARELVREAFATGLREARMEIVEIDVSFPRPDVALARTSMRVGPFVDDDGGSRPAEPQISLSVLTKEGGRWSVRAFQNTRVSPAGEESPRARGRTERPTTPPAARPDPRGGSPTPPP